MRRGIRGLTGAGTVLALAATLTAGALDGGAATVASQAREYLVFYADGAHDRAIDAIDASGGTALSTETRLGYIVAGGPASRFVEDLAASDAVVGVSSDRRIGSATALPATGAPALPATGAPRPFRPPTPSVSGALRTVGRPPPAPRSRWPDSSGT